MTIKQIDQKIKDVKLSGQMLISQFTDILGIEASVLKEKKIDDSDFCKDVELHFKMQKHLRNDLANSNLSINDKRDRAESVLSFSVKYLEDLEKLLKLAKDRKLDKDNKWQTTFENLKNCIENFKNEIAALEEYLQRNENS
jgi:hypothetical protein